MSARLTPAIVHIATAVMRDPDAGARYCEQWLVDVDGAAKLAVSPLRWAGRVGSARRAYP
jgi:hypothetical protein